MASRYYFAVTALPPLSFGIPPEITFKELRDFALMNLNEADMEKFLMILQPIDLYNVKALWMGLPLDEKGTLGAKELEEALLIRDLLPEYLIDFLDEHESVEERLRYFSSLYASMYRQKFKGFLDTYFQFEREVYICLTALRAKKTGRDIIRELQFEDPTDPMAAQAIAQKDMPEYDPPSEYADLKEIFVQNYSDPRKLSLAIAKYRFDRIGEWEENEQFTLDRFIAYAARLLILESILQIDKDRAREAVEELSKYG